MLRQILLMTLVPGALALDPLSLDHHWFRWMFEEEKEVCRGLVLQGGGSNGAWEAGVLWGFLHYGNPKDFEYDVVSGVSAGAMNAYVATLFRKGEELEFTEVLAEVWSTANTSDIITKENWLERVDHVIQGRSLLDNSATLDWWVSQL